METPKIIVHFVSVGSAILKNPFVKVKADEPFQVVMSYLRKQLRVRSGDGLYLYVNAAFAPSPDELVGNLYRCFGNKKLVVHYSQTPAYG
ncbi:MAG: hypothetical protein SGCHY_000845 [Lobulomycetales sp.]